VVERERTGARLGAGVQDEERLMPALLQFLAKRAEARDMRRERRAKKSDSGQV
jgi:hypothetical protein